MPLSPFDTILDGRPRGTATQWKRAAKAAGAKRLTDVYAYIDTVFTGAPFWGLDPSMVVAQSAHETGNWTSYWWEQRLNPSGLGITGDPAQNEASWTWTSGVDAARSHMAHLLLYATGKNQTGWFNPREGAYRAAYGPGSVQAVTLNDLTGKWATDSHYGQKIAERGNALVPGLPNQQSIHDPVGGTPVADKPYILLVAGHRSYQDAGNPVEKNLTDNLARLYTEEFRTAGYRADWWQRDLDKDSDSDDTVGGLDTVSLGVANYLKGVDGPKVLLDLHFNGGHSPVHAIVPDSRGLTTAYSGGSPADDTYFNNTLDREAATKWAVSVATTFGLSVFRGDASEPGIMLERETGVGLQGYRLATMAASAPLRADTIRLVLEHAGTDDWGSGSSRETKFRQCAKIAVAVISGVYNITSPAPSKPVDPPKKPRLMKRTKPSMPIVSRGNIISLTPRRYTLAHNTTQYAGPKAQEAFLASTTKLPKGKTVTFVGATVGIDSKGSPALFFFSTNGTYALASDVLGD